jgi:TM2 domain-containing membrane protein YozV
MKHSRTFFLLLLLLYTSSPLDSAPDEDEDEAVAADEDVGGANDAVAGDHDPVSMDCSKLLPGQYLCTDLNIDKETQQPAGCNKDSGVAPKAHRCLAVPGIVCQDPDSDSPNATFFRDVPCKWTNGYDFETSLLLSVFLGMFGADRFYLGYPALGLLKFSTLGFFFLGHLLDIVLIASQVVGPADGSAYVISYFGPGIEILGMDDETDRKPMPDWY